MNLLTESQKSQLIANACAAREAAQRGREVDPFPVVKLLAPDGYLVCLIAELDPHGGDYAYGLYDDGHGHPYEGFVVLSILEQTQRKLGFRIECDEHFVATQPLSAYTAKARARGLIQT
jgi:hypothetical protein